MTMKAMMFRPFGLAVIALAVAAPGVAMAQLSTNKDGRESVPGGVEARPGESDGTVSKSTSPNSTPPSAPPRTRGMTGSPPAQQAPAPAPAPSKSDGSQTKPQANADKAKTEAAKVMAMAAAPNAKAELKPLAETARSASVAAQKAAEGYAALEKTGKTDTQAAQAFAKTAQEQADAAAAVAKKAAEVK
jgi:hypothetical protein